MLYYATYLVSCSMILGVCLPMDLIELLPDNMVAVVVLDFELAFPQSPAVSYYGHVPI